MESNSVVALFLGEFLAFLMLFIVWILWHEGDRRLALKTVISAGITLGIVYLLKLIFPTDRPFVLIGEDPMTIVAQSTSFPSAHSALAFAIAVSVWLAKHRLGIFMLLMALLVAVGRVLLWVHFPIDVIVGGMIGAGVSFFLAEILHTRKRNFT